MLITETDSFYNIIEHINFYEDFFLKDKELLTPAVIITKTT